MAIDFTGYTTVDAPIEQVTAVVADLGTYPRWLGIVRRAQPDGEGAWLVDIGARVGPFSRTKRLRMTRTGPLRFERGERDGRPHVAWVLAAEVEPAPGHGQTALTVRLHYAGGVALPGLDLLLGREAAKAGPRLARLCREAN